MHFWVTKLNIDIFYSCLPKLNSPPCSFNHSPGGGKLLIPTGSVFFEHQFPHQNRGGNYVVVLLFLLPGGIYIKGNFRTMSEICSRLTIKTPEFCNFIIFIVNFIVNFWFMVNFEQVLFIVLLFWPIRYHVFFIQKQSAEVVYIYVYCLFRKIDRKTPVLEALF